MKKLIKSFNIFLTISFCSYLLIIFARIILLKTNISFVLFTSVLSFLYLLLVLTKKTFNYNRDTLQSFIKSFWLYLENNFFQDFLDHKKIWNLFFNYILSFMDSVINKYSVKEISFFCFYLPWISFLSIFFFELLINEKIFFTLYLFFFFFFLKKTLSLFLYIALVKFYQLERTAFKRFFSCFSENCSLFFIKNTLFRIDLLFFQNSLSNCTKIFLWNATKEIDYYFLKRTHIFYIKSVIPVIEEFIMRINFLIFSSLSCYFLFLQKFFVNNILFLYFYLIVLFLLLFYTICVFLSGKYIHKEEYLDLVKVLSSELERYKIALIDKNNIDSSSFIYFKLGKDPKILSKQDLIHKKIEYLLFLEAMESLKNSGKSHLSEIQLLASELNQSFLLTAFEKDD